MDSTLTNAKARKTDFPGQRRITCKNRRDPPIKPFPKVSNRLQSGDLVAVRQQGQPAVIPYPRQMARRVVLPPQVGTAWLRPSSDFPSGSRSLLTRKFRVAIA